MLTVQIRLSTFDWFLEILVVSCWSTCNKPVCVAVCSIPTVQPGLEMCSLLGTVTFVLRNVADISQFALRHVVHTQTRITVIVNN
jgi:hypothetical protein